MVVMRLVGLRCSAPRSTNYRPRIIQRGRQSRRSTVRKRRRRRCQLLQSKLVASTRVWPIAKRERAPALSPTLPRARDRLQNGRLATAPRVSALRERPRCAHHGRCAHARAPGRLRSASPSARVSFLKAPAWTRHPSRRARALDGARGSLREGEGRLIATPHRARDGRPMDMNIRRRPPSPTPPHHGGRSRVRAMSRPRTTKALGAGHRNKALQVHTLRAG